MTLEHALRDVQANAYAIDGGANEIRSAADDLSRRTEQQASSLEETAAALEGITATVKDTAKRANSSTVPRKGVERAGEVVEAAVAAMKHIEQSSSKISNIIGVIDEIDGPVAAPAPRARQENMAPVASPARQLTRKIASAFGGKAGAATAMATDWQEF